MGMEASDQTYEPGQYTVEEVIAYLEANPDKVETVKALEASGQNRTGIAKFSVPEDDTVVVRVLYPHDAFDPSMDNVPVITKDGTRIKRDRFEAVKAAAERSDTRVEEVGAGA
jgi:hypothetical protein